MPKLVLGLTLGAVISLIIGSAVAEQLSTTRWRIAEAQLDFADLIPRKYKLGWRPDLRYRYTVDGVTYLGRSFALDWSDVGSGFSSFARNHGSGDTIVIRHHPVEHDWSTVRVGFHRGTAIVLVFGLCCTLGSATCAVELIRRARHRA